MYSHVTLNLRPSEYFFKEKSKFLYSFILWPRAPTADTSIFIHVVVFYIPIYTLIYSVEETIPRLIMLFTQQSVALLIARN